jgi:leucyl/phenylalanyl-tRNA--protein transferase
MSTITPQLLLKAYTAGIFPMAESAQDNALYWVEPEVRGVIPLDRFHVPRKLARQIRKGTFAVTVDRDFEAVIAACAGAQGSAGEDAVVERPSTWINARISALYAQLHAMGCCHSIEVRDRANGQLGRRFVWCAHWRGFLWREHVLCPPRRLEGCAGAPGGAAQAGGFKLLDTQFVTDHLKTFGCIEASREAYREMLEHAIVSNADFMAFSQDDDADAVLKAACG